MLPSKRPSPFQRARSFQNSHARRGATRADENDGSPLPKRSGFARALSGPFQVLSPSLKMAKNPFEKLVPLSPLTGCSEFPVSEERRPFTVKKEDEDAEEDEALDPNRTLSLFSASQSNTTNSLEHASLPDDSDEEELLDDLEQEPSNSKSSSLSDLNADVPLESRKPRLHEALAMASIGKRTQVARELPAPEISSNSSKKMGTEHKTSHAVPIDWTLKSSLSITSPDSLMWCDSGSTLDEVEAMQRFVSKPGSFLLNKEVDSLSASTSARTRLLAATYHWAYPTNTPTLPQAQSITRLLKNTNNMTSGEKNSISELFSRSAEWKQAFEALYRSCRHGACVYFYYVGTTWTILFQHESVSLSGEIEAVLTNSTPGLRKVLQDEDIKFERLPDVTRKTTVHNFSSKHDLENFDDHDYEEGSGNGMDPSDMLSISKAPLRQPENHDMSDTLLFKGQIHVHGLFSYLLNLKISYEDGYLYQSPSLIADVPFLHAGLKRAHISNCRSVSKHIEGTDRMQKEFRVDIQGVLLPTSTREIYAIFAGQQAKGYNSIASSDARSLGLNLRPLLQGVLPADIDITAFAGPKSLDQLRYDHDTQQFSWLS